MATSKVIKEIVTDVGGNTTIEYSDDTTQKYNVADVVTAQTNPLTGGIDMLAGADSVFTLFGGPIHSKLFASKVNAVGKNPLDCPASATQPLVSAVTISAAAYSAPKTYNYFDVDGYKRIPIVGVPAGDIDTAIVNSSGYAIQQNASNISGPGQFGMAFANNSKGNHFIEVDVTCSSIQINLKGSGLSSNYFPIWVNGIAVAPASPSAISNSNIQIDFVSRGTYNIRVGFEQSIGASGVTVSEDDTVHPVSAQRLPVVFYGDSYISGSTSPQRVGGIAMVGAVSHIGGINAIACGVTSTGYVTNGGVGLPLTSIQRLQFLCKMVNQCAAPLVVIPAGYNDVSAGATSANIKSAAYSVISYILANTGAKVAVFGAMPGSRNNSAAQQAVDLGISSAISDINSYRVAFIPVSGSTAPWVTGTRTTSAPTGGVAGNARYYTGDDSVHPSPFTTNAPNIPANTTTSSGVEYLARRIVDSLIETSRVMGW